MILHTRLFTFLGLFSLLATLQANAEEMSNSLAAVVNGKNPITQSEVENVIKAQTFLLKREHPNGGSEFEEKLQKLEEEALQDLIDRELILSEFEQRGAILKRQFVDQEIDRFVRARFDGDQKKFIEELGKTGMTFAKFREIRRKMLVVSSMRGAQSRNVSPPTPDEREQFLKEKPDIFREKSYVSLQTITIPRLTGDPGITPESQKRLIQDIRTRVVNGADFASEAKTYSQDSASEKGGDRGWISEGDLNRKITDAAFHMKPGQTSQIIEDKYAYYILKVIDTRPGKLKPREIIENDLNRLTLQKKRQAAYEKWIGQLRAKANIRRYQTP